MNSLNESMILSLTSAEEASAGSAEADIDQLARRYCGRTIFVNWPHLLEAKVVAVSTRQAKHAVQQQTDGTASSQLQKTQLTQRDSDDWCRTEKESRTRHATRWGVEIGRTETLVYACPIIGRKFVYTQNGRVTLEKQWASTPTAYVLQATVIDMPVKDAYDNKFLTLAQVFPANSVCFMLGQPGYGLLGRVLSSEKQIKSGKVRVEFDNVHEPDNEAMKQRWMSTSSSYMPSYMAAKRLGVSPHLLSRITGTVLMNLTPDPVGEEVSRAPKPRKINVGLNLKFNKRSEEVPGWSRKVDAGWQYSLKTVQVLANYMKEFPDFFDHIDRHSNCEVYDDVQIFGDNQRGIERGRLLNDFVLTLECMHADRQVFLLYTF